MQVLKTKALLNNTMGIAAALTHKYIIHPLIRASHSQLNLQ
jgi:hypothetical protein